jgi:transcriptional regulator with XRE-family HTH domain
VIFTNDVSRNIAQLRKHYDLTQDQLGAIAGKSGKAVSAWENGARSPHVKTVKKIANHFGINPAALSGEDIGKNNDMELSDEEKAHILHLRSMDGKIKDEIMTRTESAAGLFPRKDAATPKRATS